VIERHTIPLVGKRRLELAAGARLPCVAPGSNDGLADVFALVDRSAAPLSVELQGVTEGAVLSYNLRWYLGTVCLPRDYAPAHVFERYGGPGETPGLLIGPE
jgi:hypothetical protein